MIKTMTAYASHIYSVRLVPNDGRIRVRSGYVVKDTLPNDGYIVASKIDPDPGHSL
jgi:hypothetical protein